MSSINVGLSKVRVIVAALHRQVLGRVEWLLGMTRARSQLGPETAAAEFKERPHVREAGGDNPDRGFDAGPDHDRDLVV